MWYKTPVTKVFGLTAGPYGRMPASAGSASEPQMIERYVFVKLKSEHATPAGQAEVRARSEALAAIAGVRDVVIGTPADAGAAKAWDLSLIVRFDSLADVKRYLADPAHLSYYEGFLEPRLQVIKAWNFEV